MKKNFMAIASLLIAAMLLMVSCAPEANVEGKVEDNRLVNASLMATAAGKALTVSSSGGDLSYTIRLEAKWDANSEYNMDDVVGEKTINLSSLPSSIDLGWISQGLWTVTVEGKRGDVIVAQGSTTKYITAGDKSVVVFLGTDTSSQKSTYLDFDITVNELASGNAGYSLKATIVNADKRTTPVNKTVGDNDEFKTTSSGNTKKYKITNDDTNSVVSLTPGYYKVTVQLLNGETVIGGITRGVLVTGESKITIKGSVSASDFAKGSLSVIDPKVNISQVSANIIKSENDNGTPIVFNQNYEGVVTLETTDNPESYAITYSVTASCDQENRSGVTFSGPTYTWTVDGKDKTGNSSITENYTAPGHKEVTCLVTYLCSVDINGSKYDFTIGKEAVVSVLVKGPAVAGEVTGEATTQTSAN